jgi:hypothetical protein
MSYIGNTNTTQAFTPAIDYFSGNGSTTAFTLSRPVASVAQVQVTIDNVAQNPSSAYTVSANTITFTSAPLSGTNNIYVYYTSPITQVIAPGQGTVNTTALGNITNIASGNSSLTLQTGSGNTTAVTVDTSQNVGIGVTPSAWATLLPVQVKNGYVAGYLNRMYVGANNYYDGSNSRYIATDFATRYYQLNGIHAWEAAPSGTAGNAITFTQVLAVEKAKSLALEGATSVTGTGISFPATQSASTNANTLDDYEEGSWTPTIGTASGTVTLGTTGMRYTRVGNMVSISGYLSVSSVSAPSGLTYISGFPFVPFTYPGNGSNCPYIFYASASAVGAGYFPFGYTSAGNNGAYLRLSQGNNITELGAFFQAGMEIWINCTYQAA